jgi:DNA-binding transcriptional MerR regulator
MDYHNLIRTADAAKICGVNSSRIRQFVQQGRLLPECKIGTNLLFAKDAVRDFAKIRRKSGRPRKS